jgi:CHAT domain-containing protein
MAAQAWIREATLQDLRDYAQGAVKEGRVSMELATPLVHLRAKPNEEVSDAGTDEQRTASEQSGHREPQARSRVERTGSLPTPERERPFAHPFYWGGFVLTGE